MMAQELQGGQDQRVEKVQGPLQEELEQALEPASVSVFLRVSHCGRLS